MVSLTIENYVKAIYQLCPDPQGKPAATGQLAAALAVSPGTVTSMLRTLSESGLAAYAPYEGVRLTTAGQSLALRVVRRHRLIELFLVRTLGLTWDEVHEEAENMEHAVSDRLIERIDDYLGRPATDPHGDPIPRADGSLAADQSRPLDQFPTAEPFILSRVLDQSRDFLRFLTESGLSLGVRGTVTQRRLEAGTITVETTSGPATLGREAAQKLLVTPCS